MLKALSLTCLNAGGASDEDIHKTYAIMASDQDCKDLFASYGELLTCVKTAGANKSLYDIFTVSLANEQWKSVYLAIARTLVAKPHSCDFERLVSAYNLFKNDVDDDRCSLSAETIDAYLHIHVNMPVLADYDPRPALLLWMKKSDRRPHDNKKAIEQDWFKTVF